MEDAGWRKPQRANGENAILVFQLAGQFGAKTHVGSSALAGRWVMASPRIACPSVPSMLLSLNAYRVAQSLR
jgi:hypothetical protein